MLDNNRTAKGAIALWYEQPSGFFDWLDDTIVASKNGVNPDKSDTNIRIGLFIVFNKNSAYYNNKDLKGKKFKSRRGNYEGGTPGYQAETLIHELAHHLIDSKDLANPELDPTSFLSDYMDDAAQNANAELVIAKCGKIIESFPKQ